MARLIIPFSYIGLHAEDGPITLGSIFVGMPGQNPLDFPKDVTAGTTGALVAQPIKISVGGQMVVNGIPIDPQIEGDYSLRIEDQDGNLIYQQLTVAGQAVTADFGTAAAADLGTADDEVPTNADLLNRLGSAAQVNTGVMTNQLPLSGALGWGLDLTRGQRTWPETTMSANPDSGVYFTEGLEDESYPYPASVAAVIIHVSTVQGTEVEDGYLQLVYPIDQGDNREGAVARRSKEPGVMPPDPVVWMHHNPSNQVAVVDVGTVTTNQRVVIPIASNGALGADWAGKQVIVRAELRHEDEGWGDPGWNDTFETDTNFSSGVIASVLNQENIIVQTGINGIWLGGNLSGTPFTSAPTNECRVVCWRID